MTTEHSLAGILEPVFAIRTEDDLGLGDTAGVRQMVDWCARHRLNVFQTLPINEKWKIGSVACASRNPKPKAGETPNNGAKTLLEGLVLAGTPLYCGFFLYFLSVLLFSSALACI